MATHHRKETRRARHQIPPVPPSNGTYYQQDIATGTQESLRTKDKHAAKEKLRAANESAAQPHLNLDLARIYLRAHDAQISERTWLTVMPAYCVRGREASRERCRRAFAGHDFDPLRKVLVVQTKAEHLLRVLASGKASVNHYLRRLVHHAEDLNWLPWTVMARAVWPKVKKQAKRGITADEHQRILAAEQNHPERQAYYQMLWLTGGSQGDIATLRRENIQADVLVYQRAKLEVDASPSCLRVGPVMQRLLETLPTSGYLFPKIALQKYKDRAAEFCRRCRLLKVKGVSLHSYRYGWAGRAAQAGYPQRFAQAALGHASAAVHAAYSRHAVVTTPSLEEYEHGKIVPFMAAGSRSQEDQPVAPDDTRRLGKPNQNIAK